MTDRYLTLQELMAWLKLGKSSIYRRISDGTLPKPVKIGNLARFDLTEVEASLEALKQTSEGGAQ